MKDLFQQISGIFSTFRLSDFFDILIVAIILYKMFQFIRETRAAQLIKGIVLLLTAYFVAQIANMKTVSYILQYIVDNGIIVMVILFQAEIRRAIERVGESSLKGNIIGNFSAARGRYMKTEKTIGDISSACASMASKKIGALIVFENKTNLGDIIKTGSVLNAESSSELLENIFYPKSPLHDGAVVVRNFRIYAASCILPLTKKKSIDRDLGTRHRAALGMSEDSDAIVVAVSEETGMISVAKKGVLERGLKRDSLRELLTLELIGEREEDKSIFDRIMSRIEKKVK